MSENRLRISTIVLLTALALATYGCGGGSVAGPAPGGGFIPALMPGAESPSSGENGNAPEGLALNTQNAQQINANQQGGTGNDLGDPNQNPRTALQQAEDDNTQGDAGNAPGSSAQKLIFTPEELEMYTQEEQEVLQQAANNPYQPAWRIVDLQKENYPLPWEHGLKEGRFVVHAGTSNAFGSNLVITCPSRYLFCSVWVEADGSLKYDTKINPIVDFTLIPPEGFPDIPLPQPGETAHAPVLELAYGKNILHVGSKVAAPEEGDMTRGVDRNGASFSSGEVQDGIGAERVLDFLGNHLRLADNDSTDEENTPGIVTFPEPPTIRLAEGTSEQYARYTAHAVQLINSALPYNKRISISSETLSSIDQLSNGEIFLTFGSGPFSVAGSAAVFSDEAPNAPKASVTINAHHLNQAHVFEPPEGQEPDLSSGNRKQILEEYWKTKHLDSRVENSDTIIKRYNDQIFTSVIVHELMHTLGFLHVEDNGNISSIMRPELTEGQVDVYTPNLHVNVAVITLFIDVLNPPDDTDDNNEVEDDTANQGSLRAIVDRSSSEETTVRSVRNDHLPGYFITPGPRSVPGNILYPIDRAALLAAYGRFSAGAEPEDLTAENLGAWSDTSFHLRGVMDFTGGGVSFGVASANGLAQPWATGPAPWMDLADNQALSESATWSGALLGVSSSSETVAGDAALSVNLENLTGQLDFTNMEKWGTNAAPGAAGSGEAWGDGDLGYTIEVRGNTFYQTGEDGDDDGYVTGAFLGVSHEAMGGVLQRADLSAAFGGKR